jgi:hypothetical protein
MEPLEDTPPESGTISEEDISVLISREDLLKKDQPELDRFSIKIDVYHETEEEEAFGRGIAACRFTKTKGIEPYSRKVTVTEEENTLSIGDLKREDVGYIFITNLEGTKFRVNPTEEELEDIRKKVVVFNGFEIYPEGMPFLGQPSADSPLKIRSLHGQAKVQVVVFPR